MREIVERSRPEGLTDNSWAGMGRENVCYCVNCDKKFRGKTKQALPREANWDPAYRQWIIVELRAPHRVVGVEQPDNPGGGWPRLNLVWNE